MFVTMKFCDLAKKFFDFLAWIEGRMEAKG